MLNIKILPILFICFLGLNASQAQTFFFLENVTFSPDPLTSTDEICVTVSGSKSTPCVYLEEGAGLTEVDGDLVLSMCFQDTSNCIQIIQAWDTTFCYGFLEPGPFNLFLEGCNYSGMGSVFDGEVVQGDVNENPVAGFSNDVSSGCANLTVNFTNTSVNADVYDWDFGDLNSSTEQNPTHTYTEVGQYTVSLTVSNSDDPENISTAEIIDLINVVEDIVVDLGDDVLLAIDGVTDLMAVSSVPVETYIWSDGSTGQNLTVNAADLLPGSSTTYSVTVTSGNCSSTDELVVMVEDTNATSNVELLEEGQLYPNPTSDFLYFLEDNISLTRVYDLNGKKVGEWFNTNTIDVKNLSIGVYIIELTTEEGVRFGRFLKM